MKITKVSPKEISKRLNKPWTPLKLLNVNDHVVRMALFKGEYHWHVHRGEDELFYVLKGEVKIRVKEGEDVVLGEGEMVVVPRGVEHAPVSEEGALVLMFEPEALKSRGDENASGGG
ncbi:MAG TPA: cupin domain-containing protein [Euryarchaeota archaeon]|nr:MAG: mannose-6-phosphate isomerase [Thermoplasmata archaeon]RLF72889.1 MAG: mannose-6-phosphate isomerase [Thermoplasmata archaeon]HDD59362.1 cupin domain-containing protein [Euryarchaeota archaeon]